MAGLGPDIRAEVARAEAHMVTRLERLDFVAHFYDNA